VIASEVLIKALGGASMRSNITHTQNFYDKKREYIARPTKVCIKCGIEKNKDQYTTDRKHRDGKYPICFECAKNKQRELYKKQPEVMYMYNAKVNKKYPEKARARNLLNRAIKRGEVLKSTSCKKCGASGVRIEGHHYKGYDNPFDVMWLCVPCHRKEDMILSQ
jgi:hypothetical protein